MKLRQIGKHTAHLSAFAAALFCGSLQVIKADEEKKAPAAKKTEAQEPLVLSFPEETKKPSSSSISGSVINGKGVITFGGEKVWTGEIKEGLRTLTSSVNSTTYAAAWDGEKLIWENVPGAGAQLSKSGDAATGGIDSHQLLKDLRDKMKKAMEEQGTNPEALQRLMEKMKQSSVRRRRTPEENSQPPGMTTK